MGVQLCQTVKSKYIPKIYIGIRHDENNHKSITQIISVLHIRKDFI